MTPIAWEDIQDAIDKWAKEELPGSSASEARYCIMAWSDLIAQAIAPLFAAPPKPVADTGVVEAARDLLASLDPDALNPEQFNAWSALAAASQRSGE